MIDQRVEILAQALTDASVPHAEPAPASAAADDAILGKYKIVRKLSEGGVPEVFLAKQVGIGGFEKPVVLKRIQRQLLDTHRLADLFLNEAKIAGRLTHPNIVQVLDVGEVDGALYLAMEYVHGKDLRDVLKKLQHVRAAMPIATALYVVRELAHALHHAFWSIDMSGEQLSVVHRNLSPHNVILSYDGTVKLLDFGVAMSAVSEHAQSDTTNIGKWMYMSPEIAANGPIDHRSDLFSLGVVLYLLCSGYIPFTSAQPKDIVKKIRAGAYKPLQLIAPEVPDELELLVGRLLSPNPDERPQSGQEVVAELTEIARQFGMEGSGPSMVQFLAQLFPDEAGADQDTPGPSKRPSGGLVPMRSSGSTIPPPQNLAPREAGGADVRREPARDGRDPGGREPGPIPIPARSHAVTMPLPPPTAPVPAPANRQSASAMSRGSASAISRGSASVIARSSATRISSPKLRKSASRMPARLTPRAKQIISVCVVVLLVLTMYLLIRPT